MLPVIVEAVIRAFDISQCAIPEEASPALRPSSLLQGFSSQSSSPQLSRSSSSQNPVVHDVSVRLTRARTSSLKLRIPNSRPTASCMIIVVFSSHYNRFQFTITTNFAQRMVHHAVPMKLLLVLRLLLIGTTSDKNCKCPWFVSMLLCDGDGDGDGDVSCS